MQEVRIDAGVLLFAFALAILVAFVVALVPAVHASRASVSDTMRSFTGTASRASRALGALVVAEVALALLLLAGAGLMTRSFAELMRVSPGFEPNNLLAVQVYLPQAKYTSAADRTRFYMDALHRINALPGVQAAAGVSALPMYPVGIDFALPFTIDGHAPPANGEEPRADIRMATPGYFEAMKMPLVRGRFIEERDLPGAPGAMVINETMARRYFDGQDPISRVVQNPHGKAQVVGIVGDVKHYGLDRAPRAELFMPAWQQPLNGMALVVRTMSDPASFVDPVRRAIQMVDAEEPIFDASTMVDVVARSVFLPRISMLLLIAFGGCALLLAAVGICGVVSYSVAERTREIGVRMALGADAPAMLTLVLRRSMGLVLVGTVCGLAAAVLATRVMATFLYQVNPMDPLVLATVSAVLAAIGLIASVVPARRATRVDPLIALRSE
jgi:predicted permease